MPRKASRPIISHAFVDGASAGHASTAGTARKIAAATWLPAATASGATPVRRRLVRLGAMPYDIVPSRHAPIAHAEPPGRKSALSAPIQRTPAKPIARPATRSGVMRSPSQSQATTAAKSGVAELKIADRPALIDCAA